MKLIKEEVSKRYRYDSEDNYDVFITTVMQYHYDSEEEKVSHRTDMEQLFFEDSGQVKENTGTFQHPNYVWFGSYHKHTMLEPQNIKEVQIETNLFE